MTETVKTAYLFEYPQTDTFDLATNMWVEDTVTVPSTPPWSTWSGRIHCSRDSWVGKRLLADSASNTIPLVFNRSGKSINSLDLETYSKGIKAPGKEDWINGMWFAPTDWSTVPMDSGRTPDRKRVPDWKANLRYAEALKKAEALKNAA
jgi:hypothetical protein